MLKQLHAESLVKALVEHNRFAVELIPFYFFRTRSNGVIDWRDYKPNKNKLPMCDESMLVPFDERKARLKAAKAKASDDAQ